MTGKNVLDRFHGGGTGTRLRYKPSAMLTLTKLTSTCAVNKMPAIPEEVNLLKRLMVSCAPTPPIKRSPISICRLNVGVINVRKRVSIYKVHKRLINSANQLDSEIQTGKFTFDSKTRKPTFTITVVNKIKPKIKLSFE